MPKRETPLMQQWREAKSRDPEALLAFRVGDFFEFFFEDAERAAPLLSLTLTTRNNGSAAEVPLAGFPAKALSDYVGRLVNLGERVAICEQVETPAQAAGRIVRREVVETVTPGTVLDDALLDERKSTYLVSVARLDGDEVGVAAFDLSTGELVGRMLTAAELPAELGKLEPAELLVSRSLAASSLVERRPANLPLTIRQDWIFEHESCVEELLDTYSIHSLDGLGVQEEDRATVCAVGALIRYVREIKPTLGGHMRPLELKRSGAAMLIDQMTRSNLELVEPLGSGTADATLLAVLDETETPMGARLLRRWLLEPLVEIDGIRRRHEAVATFSADRSQRSRLTRALAGVSDLERLAGKLGLGRAAPRDLAALRSSLAALPELRETLLGFQAAGAPLFRDPPSAPEAPAVPIVEPPTDFLAAACRLDLVSEALALLGTALADEPPIALAEGGVIREGWNPELDELRKRRDGARKFIVELERRESQATGIGSLKVGYNRVFGYYLEVTRTHLAKVPERYLRRQTLAGAERFVTPELKEWEAKIVDAETRAAEVEARAFDVLRTKLADFVSRIQTTARLVAETDVLSTFSRVAERRSYTRPEMHDGFDLEVRSSRHPVVETTMPPGEFIPNDLTLDAKRSLVVLTGPNMAGKSTVLRQIGLVQLLAQIGSYVPATRARLPVADRIFTRVGASDNLARGQSTFMVEMNETSAIVHGASDRSLILLDEIGRGTSTYDGVSIAWAVTEHIHDRIGAKTVFATHYHELTKLGDDLERAGSMNIAVREIDDRIVFLRRLREGGADRSYGVQVAKLAGMPEAVVERARELLAEFEGIHGSRTRTLKPRPPQDSDPRQLSVFHVHHPVVARLRALNPDGLAPREALELLYELAEELRRS